MHTILLIVGIAAFVVGGTMLTRPGAVCQLLGFPRSEGATHALRMAGTMSGAFGLAVIGFALVLRSV